MYVGLGPVVARARVLVHEILDRGAQAVVRGGSRCASQVLDRGAKANIRGAALVFGRCVQAVSAAALIVRRRYLIVVPRAMFAAPLRYLIVVRRPLPTAPIFVHRRAVFIYRGAQAVAFRRRSLCAAGT